MYGPLPELPAIDGHAYTSGFDLAALCCLARQASGILEFGTARGQTTLQLARACPAARVVTIDVWSPDLVPADAEQRCDLRPHTEVGAAFRSTPEARRITQVWIDPSEPYHVAGLASLLPECDFAFVDSLHTYPGVVKDTAAAAAVIGDRPGVIVWDDYLAAGVPVLLRKLDLQFPGLLTHVAETRLVFASGDLRSLAEFTGKAA